MGSVVGAVIFDFYGTLAHWAEGAGINYPAVFDAHGYALPDSLLDRYFALYDGIDHYEYSVSEETYERWVRARLRQLAETGGVHPPHLDAVVDSLRAADQGPMVAYPEAEATLRAVRDAGLIVGVCSNWGWELDAFLDEVGLLDLVDSAITSARAGTRKPHPDIYAGAARALGTDPNDIVFVGDSWEPDVRGPRRMGMTAVHVWRHQERLGQVAPDLHDGDYRVADLRGVLDVLGFDVDADVDVPADLDLADDVS
jgi:putative hydrolase of the HAD superfamily